VLQSPFVQEAFRAVDRGMFVYPDMRDAVYVDAPIKQNNLHQR
jgi:protein-L-isoaspartate O-methyltransferase